MSHNHERAVLMHSSEDLSRISEEHLLFLLRFIRTYLLWLLSQFPTSKYELILNQSVLKRLVQHKMKIRSTFTHPHVI